jgi:hypothetical protein
MYRALTAVTLAAGLLLTASAAYAQHDPGRERDTGSAERERSIGSAAKESKPTCRGERCAGLDPIAQGCHHDGRTTYRLTTRYGHLERRYSRACDASWARITRSTPESWFYVQTCYDSYVSTYRVPGGYDDAYTDMVPGSRGIRVGDRHRHGPC